MIAAVWVVLGYWAGGGFCGTPSFTKTIILLGVAAFFAWHQEKGTL